MSNLKIYGIPLSRAYRALWMANELGLDYENVPIHFADGSAKTPEYLAVNPNGRIPCRRRWRASRRRSNGVFGS
jgi:glutathione S-transferase